MGKTITTYLIDGDPKGTQYVFISNKILESLPADEADPKQKTVDAVMEYLEVQHNKVGE